MAEDEAKREEPKPKDGEKRRIDAAAIIAMLVGLAFVVVGLLLAISALPIETKRGIAIIGALFPADVGTGRAAAQDTLFFLGFGIFAVGLGLILAEGFTERYTFTYLGVSIGSTLGIVGIIFAGWKAIAEPPVFRYATIRFICPDNSVPAGDLRLRLRPNTNTPEQREELEAGLLELEHDQYGSKAVALTEFGPAGDGSQIRKKGQVEYYLPLVLGGDKLFLPTLLAVRHEVFIEYKPPVVPGAEGLPGPIPLRGSDLRGVADYQKFLRIDVLPQAIEGSRGFSLQWEPQLLEATIYVEKIEQVCPEKRQPAPMDAELDN